MSSWDGKTKGGILGYKIFVFVLQYAGLSPAYFILRFVALYYFLFSASSNRNIYYLYRERLEFGFWKSIFKIYSNYYIFGQTLIDKVVVLAGFKGRFTYVFDGEEHILQIINQNKGGILISAHAGNWEIAADALNRLDQYINIVVYDGEHRQIKEYLSSVMKKTKVNVIVVKNDMAHIYEITNALERKELVCIHGDRYIEGSKTAKCDFIGENALFPSGLYYLAAKLEVPVCFVFAMKESMLKYHFYASPVKVYTYPNDRTKREEVIQAFVQDYVRSLENMIYKYPTQWFNYYKFWM